MRLALVIAGVVLIPVGAVWIGQGTGYFPSSSLHVRRQQMGLRGRGNPSARLAAPTRFCSRKVIQRRRAPSR